MANKHNPTKRPSVSVGSTIIRVAGLTFVPMLLPASWMGAINTAWAACPVQPDGSYLCSGTSTGETLAPPTGSLTVTADSTLTIDSTGTGIDLTSTDGDLSFSQESGSVIKGATGIDAKQHGSGTNTLTIAGDVTGTDENAIFATSTSTAGDINIEQTAGTITGITHGIRVDNYGIGSTTITTAGTITETDNTSFDTYGVYAYNAPSARDITLTQTGGTVSGHYFGIYGNNQGTGSTTITVASDVSATGQAGVAGFNGPATQDVRISQTAGTITGQEYGILASNEGTGTTDVITDGTIISPGFGIFAANSDTAKALSITQVSGTISAGDYGVLASNAGPSPTTVTVNGKVSGDATAGIFTTTASGATINVMPTATVSTLSGFAIQNSSVGAVLVNSAGQVTGDSSLGQADSVFNLKGGSYSGNIYGDERDTAESSDGIVNAEGNDTFRWTDGTLVGGFFGQDGSDTATISAQSYDGSQILDGGDDTSEADGMVDTLYLAGVKATSHGANIANWEIANLDGATLAIDDGAWQVGAPGEAATGVFLSNGATLDGMDALALDGGLNIDATSSFLAQGGGAGTYTISGNVGNAGIINMQDGAAGDTTTIAGNYAGSDGQLQIDTVLGDDSAKTDKLMVGGDTSGATRLLVNNAGGSGAATTEGIRVIGVGGQSNGKFSLVGDYTVNDKPAIVAGAYAYQLYQGGVSTPEDGDWYLRSQLNPSKPTQPDTPVAPLYQAGVPTYEAYPQALLALNGVPTLQERVGNRFWAGAGNPVDNGTPKASTNGPDPAIEGNGVWGRMEGAYRKIKPHTSTSDTTYDQDIFRLQLGVDRLLRKSANGKLIGGVAVHYAHGKTNTQSEHGDGGIDTDGYGIGGTLTWYHDNGFYLDGQARATWYDSDLDSKLAQQSLDQGNDGFGYALSIESGKRIALNSAWSLTPQAQLVYSSVDFETFTDPFDARVSNARGDSLQGRLGVALDRESSHLNADGKPDRTHVYGLTNLHYEFLDGTKVKVADESFVSRHDRLWASLGVGGSYNWNDDKYSLYGEGLVSTSLDQFGDSYSVVGRVGFRMRW